MSLQQIDVKNFMMLLGSNSPAPGGGSASALVGAAGISLCQMAASLTVNKKKYAEFQENAEQVLGAAATLTEEYLNLMERDTEAFQSVMLARKLPKDTEAQKSIRNAAIQSATKKATLVPLEMLRLCLRAMHLLNRMRLGCNPNCISDLGVGASCIRTAAEGAYLNVCINLDGLSDTEFVEETYREATQLKREVCAFADTLSHSIEQQLVPDCNQTEG